MQDAVASTDGGCLVRVELSPGADGDAFPSGYNPWRDRVKARVRAPPRNGEANAALVELVAERFGLGPDEVRIQHGATSRRKTLRLAGLGVEEARARLEEVLPE